MKSNLNINIRIDSMIDLVPSSEPVSVPDSKMEDSDRAFPRPTADPAEV